MLISLLTWRERNITNLALTWVFHIVDIIPMTLDKFDFIKSSWTYLTVILFWSYCRSTKTFFKLVNSNAVLLAIAHYLPSFWDFDETHFSSVYWIDFSCAIRLNVPEYWFGLLSAEFECIFVTIIHQELMIAYYSISDALKCLMNFRLRCHDVFVCWV